MEEFNTFLTNNYIIITVIAGVILLSLIGYLAENLTNKDVKIKKDIPDPKEEEPKELPKNIPINEKITLEINEQPVEVQTDMEDDISDEDIPLQM